MLNFRIGMYSHLELKAKLMYGCMFIMLPGKGQQEKVEAYYYVVMVIFYKWYIYKEFWKTYQLIQ